MFWRSFVCSRESDAYGTGCGAGVTGFDLVTDDSFTEGRAVFSGDIGWYDCGEGGNITGRFGKVLGSWS